MPTADTLLHPVAIAQVMVNFAAQLGADRDTCLLGTGLTEAALLDSDTLVTRAQEMRLIENLILALPDEPALGFRLGLQYSLSNFGLWGFALRTSRTLREAAHRALRYLPLSTAYCQITPIDDAGGFGVVMDPDTIASHLRQFLLERDMATGFNLLNELSLAGKLEVTLAFRGPPPDYADAIAQACAVTPTYHSAHNAIMVRSDDADRPLPTYDAQLVRMLDDQCRIRLQRLRTASLGDQVRQHLHGPLGLVASLDEIARALSLSPRSLRRKLDQEGTSFRTLVEDERRQIALQFLRSSEMKLDELAIHLGYTDTASFTRAFRRWMGCSPGEYRQQQSKEGQ